MSYSLNYPYTDSSSTVTRSVNIPTLVWSSDWAVTNRGTTEGKLINLTTPLDAVETVAVDVTNIRDIYANTSIDRSLWAVTRQGKRIHCQLNDVLVVTDSNDPSFRVALPFSASLQVRFPVHELIDSTVVEHEIARLLGTMFEETDTSMKPRLGRLMFGATIPEVL